MARTVDEKGFPIRCKHTEWAVIRDDGAEDIVCTRFTRTGYHVCDGDENCRYYEPMEGGQDGKDKDD